MIQCVEGIDLDDVILHYAPEGTEFLLVLAHLRTIGGFCLLDPFDQLVDLLPGGIKLAVDRVIFGRKAVVVPLQGYHLLGEFLLLGIQVVDEAGLGRPDVGKSGSHDGSDSDESPHDCLEALVLPLLFFTFAALRDRIYFCHNPDSL